MHDKITKAVEDAISTPVALVKDPVFERLVIAGMTLAAEETCEHCKYKLPMEMIDGEYFHVENSVPAGPFFYLCEAYLIHAVIDAHKKEVADAQSKTQG